MRRVYDDCYDGMKERRGNRNGEETGLLCVDEVSSMTLMQVRKWGGSFGMPLLPHREVPLLNCRASRHVRGSVLGSRSLLS